MKEETEGSKSRAFRYKGDQVIFRCIVSLNRSTLFYKASRVPHQTRVLEKVPTPFAHHCVNLCQKVDRRQQDYDTNTEQLQVQIMLMDISDEECE